MTAADWEALSKMTPVSMSAGLGTIALERVLDLVALTMLERELPDCIVTRSTVQDLAATELATQLSTQLAVDLQPSAPWESSRASTERMRRGLAGSKLRAETPLHSR